MLAIIALNYLCHFRPERALCPSDSGKFTLLMTNKSSIQAPSSFTLLYILSGLILSILALSSLNTWLLDALLLGTVLFDPLLKLLSGSKSAVLWFLGGVASFRAATYASGSLIMKAAGNKEKVI